MTKHSDRTTDAPAAYSTARRRDRESRRVQSALGSSDRAARSYEPDDPEGLAAENIALRP